jgi:hypothetical protein
MGAGHEVVVLDGVVADAGHVQVVGVHPALVGGVGALARVPAVLDVVLSLPRLAATGVLVAALPTAVVLPPREPDPFGAVWIDAEHPARNRKGRGASRALEFRLLVLLCHSLSHSTKPYCTEPDRTERKTAPT